MSRLDAGIAKMNRQSCKVLEKKIKKEDIMSCVDPQRVMDSTTRKLKPKAGMASLDLTKQLSRDDLLYRQTESMANTLLENDRDEREDTLKARYKANRQL